MEALPASVSADPGSNQALGLGLDGNPESGLSSPLSDLQCMFSGPSPSDTFGKFNLPTISTPTLLNASVQYPVSQQALAVLLASSSVYKTAEVRANAATT